MVFRAAPENALAVLRRIAGVFNTRLRRYRSNTVGVKRVERRRMKDLREEVGTKACTVGK